ncbi:hypothetical protein D1007_21403 [Hordeum vulgare]|nr:hypothetical protein D1007_21403 [Hordeum vulgare]
MKKHIPAITVDGQIITDQRGKEDAFYKEYPDLLGKDVARKFTLNLDELDVVRADLSDQDCIFHEEEIWKVVKELPPDRAPGPGGFIGLFFEKAWEIIKVDIIAAL